MLKNNLYFKIFFCSLNNLVKNRKFLIIYSLFLLGNLFVIFLFPLILHVGITTYYISSPEWLISSFPFSAMTLIFITCLASEIINKKREFYLLLIKNVTRIKLLLTKFLAAFLISLVSTLIIFLMYSSIDIMSYVQDEQTHLFTSDITSWGMFLFFFITSLLGASVVFLTFFSKFFLPTIIFTIIISIYVLVYPMIWYVDSGSENDINRLFFIEYYPLIIFLPTLFILPTFFGFLLYKTDIN